ncbi:MFS transporter [Agrococcus carbonis]|uniref:Predicted arabinose efflux permease, MFS family n=1 Tax=Agrococcus carbonis TaxID=684552 RepID=A0A1H1Q5E9_9MICO|nr:MFS transporter [Agrococcus carbonis]SDS18732.1 Predicted arabinose efflux permease, MFS family [Agrococcus carbonis]
MMFRSLKRFNYRTWFTGALISNVGAWMQSTALSWTVLTVLTANDATAVGLNMALQFAPQLLLVPVSGLIADKYDRRKVLLVTQSTMGVLALVLGIVVTTGVVELWHVQLFALAFGIVQAFDMPARQAFVSELVGQDDIANAVALNSASFHGARLLGPAVAGVLIALVQPGPVFLINAVTFIAMLVALMRIRTAELVPSPRGAKGLGDIVQGFRYVKKRHDLLVIFVMAFILGTFGLNFPIYISTMTATEFRADADTFGVLSSAMAIGSVTGALLSARSARPRWTVVIGGIGAFAIACTFAAWVPSIWLFGAALAVAGFTAQLFMTNANSMVQLTSAPEVRGRVMALYGAVFMGGTPIGAPIVGWVADAFGPRWGIMVAAFTCLAAFAIGAVYFARVRRDDRMSRTGTLTLPPPTESIDVVK